MADYKLSHTADEIDEKLKKIEEGGTGYTEGETVHTIDPKYLPGVCLPVVELSGELADIGIECTDAEGEALQAAVESGLPCVLNIAAIGISCVATNGGTALIAYYGTEAIVCHKIETGKWIVIIQNEG